LCNHLVIVQNTLTWCAQTKYPTVQLFIGTPDGHTTFTTSLCLDTCFLLAPRTLHYRHPAASDAPRFCGRTGRRVTNRCRCESSRRQAFNASMSFAPAPRLPTRQASIPLDSTDVVFITYMYSCSFVHHVDRQWLRQDSLGFSVQAYTTRVHPSPPLVHRDEPFGWPSPHAIDRHIASNSCTLRSKRYIKYIQRCQSLIIQG